MSSGFDAVGLAAGRAWWDAGVVICLKRRADLHMAQLMPLPLSKIHIGFTFLVLAHLNSSRHRAIKRVSYSDFRFLRDKNNYT